MSRGLAVLLGRGRRDALWACRRRSTRAWGRPSGACRRRASRSWSTIALVAIAAVVRGGLGNLGHVGRAPWWAWIGGLLGAVYVTVALVAVRTLGASGLTAVVITGQLVISVVIDRFGLLGVARQHVGAQRIVGLVLLAAGVLLVVRK